MRKQFDFYGYNSPTDGKFYVDDTEYFYGEDFRNKKRYKEYKDIGFTVLLLQHENSYDGEDYATSSCKKCLSESLKAGIKRVIVSDRRIKKLCIEKELVGENGRFKTEKEFLDYLDFCTKPYRVEKNFYGIQLYDEPEYHQLDSYGKVCKGLKSIIPNVFLQCNLLTLCDVKRIDPVEKDPYKAFYNYLNAFLDKSGMNSIIYDEYPLRRDYIIGGYSLITYQVAARVSKERNVEFHNVLQSWAYGWIKPDGLLTINPRFCNKQDMYWQLNLLMGLGCVEYAFFTYFTKKKITLNGGSEHNCSFTLDGASLVNRDGTKTKLYFDVQTIIRQMKKFAPIILQYKYDNNYFVFGKGTTYKDYMQTEFTEQNTNCPIKVVPSSAVGFITELKKGNSSLFMIENLSNIKDEMKDKKPILYDIDLGAENKKINVYRNGAKVKKEITDGKFVEPLYCGEAIFIEIKREINK